MAGRVRTARLLSAPEEDRVKVAGAGDGRFAFGRLRWIGGANSGLWSDILSDGPPGLRLREPPAFAPAPGDLVELREGCDRRFSTCTGRFANGANFRGEPHLPGIDLLTRYRGG
jgi:uncharacterized phage protein (TIGR02218 family)